MEQTEAVLEGAARILVVDDEPTVCRSLEKILTRKGYEVSQATCVSGALDSLESGQKFDLIIADLMMPQVSGIELLKIVRERWPDTPVLIITGYASIASAVEATRSGAVGYIPKPFTPDELEKAVDYVMSLGSAETTAQGDLPSSGPIDVDLPFDGREVALATSPRYVERLTRSDLPLVEHKAPPAVAQEYCSLGKRACKRFVTKGMCKLEICPIVAAERRKAAQAGTVTYLSVPDPIDVDMPFSYREVASMTSVAYANALGRSDLPIVGHWRSAAAAESTPNVLVVDDEPVVANSIRKILTRRALRVEEAFTAKEALTRIASEKFDLVFLDMRLPDANGLDIISDIKLRKPQLQVVIVTGYASIDTAVEAIRRGASDYMAKPFTPEELYGMTKRVLDRAVA